MNSSKLAFMFNHIWLGLYDVTKPKVAILNYFNFSAIFFQFWYGLRQIAWFNKGLQFRFNCFLFSSTSRILQTRKKKSKNWIIKQGSNTENQF